MANQSGGSVRRAVDHLVRTGVNLNTISTAREIWSLSTQVFVLVLALYVNRKAKIFFPDWWIIIPILISLTLAWARYRSDENLLVRLWQFIGVYSAFYSFTFYPLIPVQDNSFHTQALYGLLVAGWVVSIASGVICLKIPSFAVFPPAIVIWSKSIASHVSGLPVTIDIDVAPLTEVSVCIGLGMLISRGHEMLRDNGFVKWIEGGRARLADTPSKELFSHLTLYIAIAIHIANYYWSFHKKLNLNGPFLSWITENNPAYIFLAALDDGHIFFSGYPTVVSWTINFLDSVHIISNIWVFLIQAISLFVFFMPKRYFLLLLLMFDIMHVAIIVIAGANFFPWIVLNIFIIFIVANPTFPNWHLSTKIIATGFLLVAPHFAEVAKLGWYDSGANNKIYLLALDKEGRRHHVPTNFFSFYSYSFGHMDYGSPEPWTSFAVGSPNGGTWDYKYFLAGRDCDVPKLQAFRHRNWRHRDEVTSFVKNYHNLALRIYSTLGIFPYNFYPHHFFIPFGKSADFRRLDKRCIVAYIYRRESVCLSIDNGMLRRKVVVSSEHRIDVAGMSSNAER